MAIFFFSFFSVCSQSNMQLLWVTYILEKHLFSLFFERMSILLYTALTKWYIFNLRMPQHSEAHSPYVSGSTEWYFL